MTLVAWDKRYLAVDSGVWSDDIYFLTDKKMTLRDGIVYVGLGREALNEAFIKWYIDGCDISNVPGKDTPHQTGELIVYDPTVSTHSILRYSSSSPYVDKLWMPIAFGCGSDLAIGAMLYGASAMKSISLVSKCHAYVKSPVLYVDTQSLPLQIKIYEDT